MKVIHFYSENADYGCFSNFSLHPVVIDGVTYPTTEHYFQAQKFIDNKIIKKVINTKKPIDAAKLGRNRDFPLRKGWESMKDEVMLKAIRAKVEQHSEVKEMLLSTENAILVEHTEKDYYWGDGGDGSGKNRLGKILMKVRDEWNSK
ncbi:NADAR family protein [Listeria monocytogenes]|uniref:NADAR family protein n=1 Tax=Listeria monocytogenes TaxID=1639 RepID=UPI0010B688E1|nr:NADAR family protein [Listeria monocytogenes]EAC3108675.1 NADAR family protein [Listeria monocytogenes]EAG3548561.1 NADAR family protein [Listeria monocytogenes]ELK7999319.1 NADAR family protein [Listeria monocytogenes]ELN9189881.1 NADAR family protein [Listeria monocytogenes]TYV56871.1 NADAR family protein [Listeria monocytogenes]